MRHTSPPAPSRADVCIALAVLLFGVFAFAAACHFGPQHNSPSPALGIGIVLGWLFWHLTRNQPVRNVARVAFCLVLALMFAGSFNLLGITLSQ